MVDRNFTEVLPGPFLTFRTGPGNEARRGLGGILEVGVAVERWPLTL